MSNPIDLASKIQSTHELLNELYSIDTNWRESGNWPNDVTGSHLHAPASDAEIDAAEQSAGHRFPPSYREFLRLHQAWEHSWGDYTLIGTAPPAAARACAEIKQYIDEQTEKLRKKLGDNFTEQGIADWEASQDRFMYLAKHLIIGTDFCGALWVYDIHTRRDDGEMTLRRWDISYGAQEPELATFVEFVDWMLSETDQLLKDTRDVINNPGQSGDDDDE